MVVGSRSSRQLRKGGNEKRRNSVAHTAGFLWLAAILTTLALAGTYVWEALNRAEQDCNHGADSAARIECTQRGDGKSSGEGQDVRHGPQSGRKDGGRA